MALTTHPELSRPYFEREARLGRRVIFQWTPATRNPGRCSLHRDSEPPDWCVNCSDEAIFEGVEFVSEQAAQSFDLERTNSESNDDCWDMFNTWEDAEGWLRGGAC